MTPERWQRVKEIFQSALDRAPEERSSYLACECGGDEALRNEVESLIASHEKDGSFIDSPAYEAVADMLTGDQELKPGQVIGSYEIISFISRGGMGRRLSSAGYEIHSGPGVLEIEQRGRGPNGVSKDSRSARAESDKCALSAG